MKTWPKQCHFDEGEIYCPTLNLIDSSLHYASFRMAVKNMDFREDRESHIRMKVLYIFINNYIKSFGGVSFAHPAETKYFSIKRINFSL